MASDGPSPLRFRRILVVMDGSDHSVDVVPWVASLAAKLHAEVRLLLAVSHRWWNGRGEHTKSQPAKDQRHRLIFRSELINRRVKNPAELDQLADVLRGRGLVVSTRVASDGRGHELIEDIAEARPDLIALSGRNWMSLASYLANGVQGNVRASEPLFLVGPSADKSSGASRAAAVFPTRVIVALDGSKDLEQSLMPTAAIAALLSVDLQLVSVAASAKPPFGWPIRRETRDAAAGEARSAAGAYAERLAAGLRVHGLSVTVDAQDGSVDRALLRAASQWHGSMVVIGSRSDVGVSLELDPAIVRVASNMSSPVLLIPKAGARSDSEAFAWAPQEWLRHGEPQGDEPRKSGPDVNLLDPLASTKNLAELAPTAADDVERVKAWLADSEIFDFSVGRYTYGDPTVVGHDFPRTPTASAFGSTAPVIIPHVPEECESYSIRNTRTHEHIGEAHIAMDAGLNAQISFLIGSRPYWHRGYGVATALALMDHLFAIRRLERIWTDVPEFNKDALTYLGRVGFRESAALRKSRVHARARFPSVVMAMLPSEYSARFPEGLTANATQRYVLMPW